MEIITAVDKKFGTIMHMTSLRGLVCALTIAGTLALSACGGSAKTETPALAPAISLAAVEGQVLASEDSSVMVNAKVTIASNSATTAADGKFSLSNLPPAARVLLKIEAEGYVDGFLNLSLAEGQTVRVSPRLQRASAASVIDPGKTSTVSATASIAQVVLSANSLVDEASGAAATGNVTARVTAINPASDPQTMPGDYSVSDTVRIESFGAVKITLRDAEGKKLNLKKGSTATIRIPLASRSANPPASIPLFYFNETTGRWVEEGSATLLGSAPKQYYEGQVAHFSYWNADQIQSTIYVNGCLVDAAAKPISGAMVQTVGLDYSGIANDTSNAAGKFRVAIQKGGRASLYAESINATGALVVGPSSSDINLTTCLIVSGAAALPVILEQPKNMSIEPGWPAFFHVVASGSLSLKYQWKRNGVNIIGANSDWYMKDANSYGENGAIYTVVVSNVSGSVTSSNGVLTVYPPMAPSLLYAPVSSTVFVGQSATFSAVVAGSPPPNYQWKRNGVDIAGANSPLYITPVLALADSGALYSLVATNSAGSVVSSQASVTVKAGSPASTDDKFKLMRILSLSMDFYTAASLPGNLTKDDGSVFSDPALVCKSGSILGTFNGAALPSAGTALPNNATLSASANACKLEASTYTGSSSVTFNIVPGNPKISSASATVNNMRVSTISRVDASVEKDFTANGGGTSNFKESVLGLDTTTEGTWTPNVGATIRSEISGLTAIYIGGSSGILVVTQPQANMPFPKTTQMRASYNDVTFSVAGSTYVANGFYELKFGGLGAFPFTGSGEVTLKANGVLIGRIFATNTGVFMEVDGVIQNF